MRRRPPSRPPSVAEKRQRRRLEQRRYRQRDGSGVKIARAPFDDEVIDHLVGTGWLDGERDHDPDAVGAAYFELVKDSARRHPELSRRKNIP